MAIHSNIDDIKINICDEKAIISASGWCYSEETDITEMDCTIDGVKQDVVFSIVPREDVQNAYNLSADIRVIGFQVIVEMHESNFHGPVGFKFKAGKQEAKMEIPEDEWQEKVIRNAYVSGLDNVSYDTESKTAVVYGWCVSYTGIKATITLQEVDGKQKDIAIRSILRNDLKKRYQLKDEDALCGFMITFKPDEGKEYVLRISYEGKEIQSYPIRIETRENISAIGKFGKLFSYVSLENICIVFEYLADNGLMKTLKRISSGVAPSHHIDYDKWFHNRKVSKYELEIQKTTDFAYSPKISIVVPTYNTPEQYLRKMIDSVIQQSYENWELCIADASDNNHSVRSILKEYAEKDIRIRVKYLNGNKGISGNTNEALKLATGEYTGLYDHDDFLEPDALFEIVKVLQTKQYDVIYTDEDKYNEKKQKLEAPHLKPDFSIDLLCSYNYITHFFVAKTELIREIGGFRKEFDGSQDYDLILRCIDKTDSIYHLPMILYHWRMHDGSTAANPKSKMYCYEAGKKAIEDHLNRVNMPGIVDIIGEPNWGCYRVKYSMITPAKISVLIPNYENKKVLDRCLNSLFHVNNYQNFEVIIIENNSNSKEIFDYYDLVQKEHKNVKVITWKGKGFNYSALNNFGARFATGEYLLLLNNDTEMINPDSLEELVSYCQRKEVGVAGAKLLYPDDTIQHSGVVIGFGSVAGHVFHRFNRKSDGYFNRAVVAGNWSAVTGACLMTKKSIFDSVGGLDEGLAVAFNDIDYCLKVRKMNKLVVLNPLSLWYHYESVSRGYENDFEKIKRFESEVAIFQNHWKDILINGDPYYNANFDVGYTPFELH